MPLALALLLPQRALRTEALQTGDERNTLLAEMTRSRWTPLADAALGLEKACLALRDPDSAAAVASPSVRVARP